jgi:hypothetical protein
VLTVSNFVTTGQPSSTQLAFLLDGLYNPYNFTALSLQVKTLTANLLYAIDEKSMTFQARTETTLSTAKLAASDTTVQEYAIYSIEFTNPIPLGMGTLFTLVFPSEDYGVFDSRLTTVQGFGLFGSLKTLKYVSDSSQRSIKILNGLDSYRAAGITGKIIIQLI